MPLATPLATEAQIGYGTLLKKGNGASPNVFTEIYEVKEISGFGFTSSQLEATHMGSPNRYKEYVSGLKDGDVFTVRVNFTDNNDVPLKSWCDAGLSAVFTLDFPSPLPTYTFAATPDSWHIEGVTPDGILEVTVGMKVAGAIV